MKKMSKKKLKSIWLLLERSTVYFSPEQSKALRDQLGENWMEEIGANEVWKNNIYTVFVRRNVPALTANGLPLVTWLSIKRNDKQVCRDWRHFQLIKNQLCGSECEGVEIFPAESRLIDGSNQFHLWILQDPADKIPFGFNEGRNVSTEPLPGGVQRQRFISK